VQHEAHSVQHKARDCLPGEKGKKKEEKRKKKQHTAVKMLATLSNNFWYAQKALTGTQ
jgi:hypothetical protein